jgi:septum formation inhibitor MinC
MSQAPSVAFAAVHEATLVGAPAISVGEVLTVAPVPTRDSGAAALSDAERQPARSPEPQARRPETSALRSEGLAETDLPASVSLRGTTRGLEILIAGTPSTDELRARLTELLAEAPGFFAGSNARVAIEGALPTGALGCLEDVAAQFQVKIVEISPVGGKRRRREAVPTVRPEDLARAELAAPTAIADRASEPYASYQSFAAPAVTSESTPSTAVPSDAPLASGSSPLPVAAIDAAAPAERAAATGAAVTSPAATSPAVTSAAVTSPAATSVAAVSPAVTDTAVTTPAAASAAGISAAIPAAEGAAVTSAATALAIDLVGTVPPGARLVIGPVRSGVIVDHPGHVIVIGDVNPCAEVRADGSIIVLGRMRGVAHAAIGRTTGFIIALSLQPQQLRIGRMVARAADTDRPSDRAEIAYATGETIVVERFSGRLPSGLAASM